MANHGTLETVDGRPALRFERRLNHPIERVWRAITEPAELARWFVAETDWIPEEGEELPAGRVTVVQRPHRLAWTWEDQRFAFELTADGDATTLVFTHVFSAALGPAYQHAAGWEAYFERLDAHLGGGFLSEEDAHAGMEERKARYRDSMPDSPRGMLR
jgi:uncharacterized protein YndB with AHSA1/START domain